MWRNLNDEVQSGWCWPRLAEPLAKASNGSIASWFGPDRARGREADLA